MKKVNRFLIVALFGTLAAFGGDFLVTGIGSGTNSNRDDADKEAFQEASSSLESSCPGRLEDSEIISNVCFNSSNDPDEEPSYRCSITLQAKCHTKTQIEKRDAR